MKKGILRILLLIIGLILLISAYALNKYNLLRTILLIIGLILLVVQSVLERNHKFIFAILFTLIYLLHDYSIITVLITGITWLFKQNEPLSPSCPACVGKNGQSFKITHD